MFMAMFDKVIINVCGNLTIEADDRQVNEGIFSRWHTRALLALLAGSNGMRLDRDAVCDVLWPDSELLSARNRLYHTVMLLRRGLSELLGEGDWASVSGGRVQLNAMVDSDAALVRKLAIEGNHKRISQWLSHMSAPLPPFAPWLPESTLVNTLRSELDLAWKSLIDKSVCGLQDFPHSLTARRQLDHLLVLAPDNEAAHRALMALDLREGRVHGVLRRYEVCARVLAEQLGLRPSRLTIELAMMARRLLATDAQGHGSLALVTASDVAIVGRDGEISMVRDAVLEPSAKVITLFGVCGVGKSRIAREVCRNLVARDADDIVWVDLREACMEIPASTVVDRVLRKRLDLVGTHDAAGKVRLNPFRGLLVLDNAPSDDDFIVQLATIASHAPRARCLVTRIRPTGVDGEKAIGILPLPTPSSNDAVEVINNPSVLLLSRHAFASDDIDERTLGMVGELARKLDGLPLALKLASCRLQLRTLSEICIDLDDGLSTFDHGPLDFPVHQRSITSALDYTIAGLSSGALTIYQVASVPATTFDIAFLKWLSSESSHEEDIARFVHELDQRGVIACVVNAPGERHWRMGHLARLHAVELARRNGLDVTTKGRHLAWADRILADIVADDDALTPHQLEELDQIHLEVCAALEHALSIRSPILPVVVSRIASYWIHRGHFAVAQRWLVEASCQFDRLPEVCWHRVVARVKAHLARLHLLQQHTSSAATFAADALNSAWASGDNALLVHIADLHVRALIQEGRTNDAIDAATDWLCRLEHGREVWVEPLRRSLRRANAVGGKPCALGGISFDEADAVRHLPDSDIGALPEAIEWASDDVWMEFCRLGLWRGALEESRRVLGEQRSSRPTHLRISSLLRCAEAEMGVEDLQAALHLATAASKLAKDARLLVLGAHADLLMSDILLLSGQSESAERILDEAKDIVFDDWCGSALRSRWHAKVALCYLANGCLFEASDLLLTLTGDHRIYEDVRALVCVAEVAVALCAQAGRSDSALSVYALLERLDRPGLFPRKSLERSRLRQYFPGVIVKSTEADSIPSLVIAKLIQELNGLALAFTVMSPVADN